MTCNWQLAHVLWRHEHLRSMKVICTVAKKELSATFKRPSNGYELSFALPRPRPPQKHCGPAARRTAAAASRREVSCPTTPSRCRWSVRTHNLSAWNARTGTDLSGAAVVPSLQAASQPALVSARLARCAPATCNAGHGISSRRERRRVSDFFGYIPLGSFEGPGRLLTIFESAEVSLVKEMPPLHRKQSRRVVCVADTSSDDSSSSAMASEASKFPGPDKFQNAALTRTSENELDANQPGTGTLDSVEETPVYGAPTTDASSDGLSPRAPRKPSGTSSSLDREEGDAGGSELFGTGRLRPTASEQVAEVKSDVSPADADSNHRLASTLQTAQLGSSEAKPPKKRARKGERAKRTLSTKANGDSDDEDRQTGLYGALAADDYLKLFEPCWEPGQPVPYSFLANAFETMAGTSGRIDLTRQLACVLYHVLNRTPVDLLPTIYLVINRLAPAHEGLEIGVGDALLLQALADATGRSLSKLREDYHRTGDLGDVAVHSRTTQRTMFAVPRLTIRNVYNELLAIARASGKAMQEEKRRRIQKLLVAAKNNEAKFIARALQGRLRIRLAEKTVILALAAAFVRNAAASRGTHPDAARVERAAHLLRTSSNECPSWNMITEALLELQDIDERLLERCHLTPGLPVMPMLAKPSRSIAEVLTRFEGMRFTCEYKYDGERAQIHGLADGSIRIYSRNAEDHTRKYPDVMEQILQAVGSSSEQPSFILDSEVVAFDRDAQRILPFQYIQQRARKHVSLDDLKTNVLIVAFDILYWRGEPLTRKPLAERRAILRDAFQEVPGGFRFATRRDVSDLDGIQKFMEEAVRDSCEGLMVKALEGPLSTYEPANRTQHWLKLKKDYLRTIGDTLDLVPIGAYYGRGKRTGWFGSFLLACYNPETEQFEAVTRVGTGFSEEQMAQLHSEYAQYVLDSPRPYVACSESVKPDIWLDPRQVWEVQCADLSISPAYVAACGYIAPDKGISVRFPRLLRIRSDKRPEDATTSAQLAEMYRNQFRSTESSSESSSSAAPSDEEPERNADD